MSLQVVIVAAVGFAVVSGHGVSLTAVSKPHEGKFDYKIDHHAHGDWHGSAHPHGYGGLGDGHGSYSLGGAVGFGVLPQGGHGEQLNGGAETFNGDTARFSSGYVGGFGAGFSDVGFNHGHHFQARNGFRGVQGFQRK